MNLTPEMFVFFLLLFTAVGAIFLFIHLVIGSFIRPYIPETEKLTIYECGEPTVGSAWVQFDLRYYVIALLFVIFDVEVAFFFPWATVFGKANEVANLPELTRTWTREELKDSPDVPKEDRARYRASSELLPTSLPQPRREALKLEARNGSVVPIKSDAARSWAQVAFWDIAVFFGVLMVGFAYLWRRGDLNWVKTFEAHQEPAIEPEHPLEQTKTAAAPAPQPVSAH
jgi:NADH-quinone oxidoreductase subunit A